MHTRLLGGSLAAIVVLSVSSAAWAQGRAHRGGATGTRQAGATVVVRSAPARVVTAVPSHIFFTQPYYSFRPRQHVGFGLYLGFPVAYPGVRYFPSNYAYPYAYPNAYQYAYSSYTNTLVTPVNAYGPSPSPYATTMPTYTSQTTMPTYPVYGYPAAGMVEIVPSETRRMPPPAAQPREETGGVSFEITPGGAALFVDGVYVGEADNFSVTTPPLLLAAGRHHFELRAQGRQPMVFDVDVMPGQVVPYRGTLEP